MSRSIVSAFKQEKVLVGAISVNVKSSQTVARPTCLNIHQHIRLVLKLNQRHVPLLEVRAGVPKQFPFLRILNVLQEHHLQCVMCIYSSIQSVCEHLMCSGGPPKTDRNRGCFHMYLILNLDSCVLCFAALHSLRNAIACHRLQSNVCLVWISILALTHARVPPSRRGSPLLC